MLSERELKQISVAIDGMKRWTHNYRDTYGTNHHVIHKDDLVKLLKEFTDIPPKTPTTKKTTSKKTKQQFSRQSAKTTDVQ